jgi:RNA polymerase sigma factor (sigma-70 family)
MISSAFLKDISVSSPDEQLVQECLEDNQAAWSALVDKYRNLIFSIPIKLGLSRDEASEVFQNVCLTLISELRRLREPRTLAAWLIQVTAHESFHWRRKNCRHMPVDLEASARELTVPAQVSDIMLDQLRQEQALREAIAELPPRCNTLIRMLFFTIPALPYEDIANKLGLAKGSIGFIRMRCLQRLRRNLEHKGFR